MASHSMTLRRRGRSTEKKKKTRKKDEKKKRRSRSRSRKRGRKPSLPLHLDAPPSPGSNSDSDVLVRTLTPFKDFVRQIANEDKLLWNADMEKRWTENREAELRSGLAPDGPASGRATVFVTLHSRHMVLYGSLVALLTIGGTIASSLFFGSDLQGLIYPFISETARDMPQTGAFGYGMTLSSMFMMSCAVLQFGKVKMHIRETDTGIGHYRNFTALLLGIIAPPFLGLLAVYDTRRALRTHRFCVVVFFSLTMIYMLLVLSLYGQLAGVNGLNRALLRQLDLAAAAEALSLPDGGDASDEEEDEGSSDDEDSRKGRRGCPTRRRVRSAASVKYGRAMRRYERSRRRCTATVAEIKTVRFSFKVKLFIAILFFALTLFYLPIGLALCSDSPYGVGYSKHDLPIHTARAVCQHLAVVCIILFYGTFYYDFGDLKFYLVHR